MNKTVTINLSGIVFHIDDNAYEVLRKYLDNLKMHFAGVQGKEEIISDIESRMAEMFTEKVNVSKNVIMMDDVQSVVEVMGRPEQVAGEEEPISGSSVKPDGNMYYETMAKRFFRSPDDRILGGVCSGISAYFDIDPIWMRLAFALSVIFAGTGVFIYIILWIIIPEARTAGEKLQMRGERVNVENIKKSVQEEMEALKKRGETFAKDVTSDENKARVRSASGKAGDFIADIFRAIIKFIVVIFGIIITILSICMLVALTMVIFSGIGIMNFAIPHTILHMVVSASQIWWLIIGGLLAIGIPFTLLLLNGLKILFKVNLNLKMIGAVMAGLWLIGLGICIIVGIQIASEYKDDSNSSQTTILSQIHSQKIIIKADRHWAINDDHFNFGDFDKLIISSDKGDSVVCPVVRLNVEPSENDSVYLITNINSRGGSYEEAHRLASQINYHYRINDSVIVLPNYFVMNSAQKYRGQNVKLTLRVPQGKSVVFDKSLGWMLDDISNVSDTWDWDMLGHEWKMTKDGLECLNCPKDENNTTWHSKNHDITIENGKVTIDKDGKHIEISNGDVQVDSTY